MATWVIVGASRGIGYEFLKQLAAKPSNTVIGTARTPSNLEEKLRADGVTNVHVVAADLDSHSSLKAAAQAVAKDHKSVDYLVINGAHLSVETATLSPTDFDGKEELFEKEMNQSILTNAIGPLYATNAFLPLVRAGKEKKIMIISTGAADTDFISITDGAPGVPYAASKAALNIIVSKFAVALKPEGIIVMAISPGFVDTEKDQAMLDVVTQIFRKYEPKFRGAITPEQSVRAMLKVFNNVAIKDSGTMISQLGNKRWISADGKGDEVD